MIPTGFFFLLGGLFPFFPNVSESHANTYSVSSLPFSQSNCLSYNVFAAYVGVRFCGGGAGG